MIRQKIETALSETAERTDPVRRAVLRLMIAALRDREAALAAEDSAQGLSDAEAMRLLRRMTRQRAESMRQYERAGHMELAEQERREIAIIQEFLPRPLTNEDVDREIARAIRETDARSIRDLGRVMGLLKARHPGRMDFVRAGERVKAALG